MGRWPLTHCEIPNIPPKANTFNFYVKSDEVYYFIDIAQAKQNAPVDPRAHDLCFIKPFTAESVLQSSKSKPMGMGAHGPLLGVGERGMEDVGCRFPKRVI